MNFTTLTCEEFNTYVSKHFSHYTQSIQLYEYRKQQHKGVHLVGVKNIYGEVIAACLLTEARVLKIFKYFYSHHGPVMDYNDLSLVKFFFKHLTRYLKKQRGLFVLIDPYILENIRNAEGEIIHTYNNEKLIDTMHRLGYEHQGFSVGYSDMSQIRWHSVLNLQQKSEDQLLKEMSYQTRRNINKTFEMGVEVITLPIEETDRFYRLFKMAEEKHGFNFREESYFEEMQKIYHDNGCIKLAYINLADYLTRLEKQRQKLIILLNDVKETLEINPNSKKSKTKYQQLTQQLASIDKNIAKTQDLQQEDGNILDLAAALYVYNNHEMYYLLSGSNPKYNQYMGAYRLQWDMICFAKSHHIHRYNFYGITGDFSSQAEDYGVQQFKKGFNAFVEEYIGDFIKPLRPWLYKFYLRK